MRLLCRIGLHRWTPWVYREYPDMQWWNEEGEHHCTRCGRSDSVFRRKGLVQ